MSDATLRALLLRSGEITVKELPHALDGATAQKMRQRIPGGMQSAAWQALTGKVGNEAVLGLLDFDLIQVLAAAWNKYRTLAEFADPARHPDGEPNEVALNDHSMSLVYGPSIDVTVNGVKLPPLEFELTIALTLKSIVLSIKDGRIMAVRSGTCAGNVKLALDTAEVVDHDLTKIELPGVIDLGRGLRIPVITRQAAEAAGPVA